MLNTFDYMTKKMDLKTESQIVIQNNTRYLIHANICNEKREPLFL